MLIHPDRALRLVLDHVRPLQAVRRPLAEVAGLCLAEVVRADRDQPPADRSAMDGYAVRAADLAAGPRELRLAGEVAAGSVARPRVRAGCCVRIFTGAIVPPGADTVVMVEDTRPGADGVCFTRTVERGANIRRRGEEARRGAVLLRSGTVLGPAQVGVCAAVGKAAPKVFPRARVAVLCTGEELRSAAERVRAHELRDANGPALLAALDTFGCVEVSHEIVADDPAVLADRLGDALMEHDVVILSGGVSVGEYDYVPAAVGAVGARVRFHGVRMKPGKPGLYATFRGNRHIFGLPGNPVSVLTGFHEFVLPALRRLSGAPAEACRPTRRLPLAAALRAKSDRVEFALARLAAGKEGFAAMPISSRGSADLAAAAGADGVVVVPLKTRELAAGAVVEFHPWEVRG